MVKVWTLAILVWTNNPSVEELMHGVYVYYSTKEECITDMEVVSTYINKDTSQVFCMPRVIDNCSILVGVYNDKCIFQR